MQIGIVGLGKMGSGIGRRLMRNGHEVVGFDLDEEAVQEMAEAGAAPAGSLEALAEARNPARTVWIMVPAGAPVDGVIDHVTPHLEAGDTLVDGGNTFYKDTLRRAEAAREQGLHYVDCGVSGGVWGLEGGFSLMVGGPDGAVERLRPVFETLAPAPDEGWGHMGPAGSGHFVKMVHNGVEYGLMQAYAEGFAVMAAKEEFGLDLEQIANTWRRGSVVRSWLLDLAARALAEDQTLGAIAPYVEDSGEGRWTVKEAIDLDIPAPVITLSLQERLTSRIDDSYAHKLLSALRHQFGGHAVKPDEAAAPDEEVRPEEERISK